MHQNNDEKLLKMICSGWALLLPAWLTLYCIQCQLCLAAQTQVILLEDTAHWTLSNVRGYNNITIHDVTIPSYVLDTLQQRGLISTPDHDLAYRYNERDLAWIADDTWTYTASFILPSSTIFEPNHQGEKKEEEEEPIKASFLEPRQRQLGQHYRVLLVLHGVDTAATITLNNHSLGLIANSHRRHVFDIAEFLLEGANLLEITIQPAAAYAATQATAHRDMVHYSVPYTKQVGNTGAYNYIRKAASDFGWDWGPSFAPSGISGGVDIIIRNIGSSDGSSSEENKNLSTVAPSARAINTAPVYLMDLGLRQHHFTTNNSIVVTADAFFRPLLTPAEQREILEKGAEYFSGILKMKISGHSNRDEEQKELQTWSSEAELHFSIEELLGPNGTKDYSKENASWVIQRRVDVLVTAPFELWWPWDLGTPVLYNVEVTFEPWAPLHSASNVLQLGRKKEEASTGVVASSYQVMHRQIGFRTVELIQDPIIIDQENKKRTKVEGETFYFKINKIPIFARGANIVPLDLVPTKITPSKIKHAVFSARHANMNFLRVWGGGRYFPDSFYEECDKNGILVWQEFMYACAMYPVTPNFYLHEATEEARQQVLRLNTHPSVVIWGGNNENEAAFQWFPETKKHRKRFRLEYEVLFVELLRDQLLSLDPDAIYVDSSPSNGLVHNDPFDGDLKIVADRSRTKVESFQIKKKWGDVTNPSQGDVHFYDYSSSLLDPAAYPPAKFISEFGYMSLPSFDSYAKQSKSEDWTIAGELMKYRMRHADGLEEIEKQLQMHFAVSITGSPRKKKVKSIIASREFTSRNGIANMRDHDSIDCFQSFIYLTQLQQALIYDTAATTWRLGKNDPLARTAGLLYWQLNDVWAGPSWSGINYDGRWKALHYAARRFFSPVGVFGRKKTSTRSGGATLEKTKTFFALLPWSLFEKSKKKEGIKDTMVEVWVVNDGREEIQGRLEVYAVPFQSTSASERIGFMAGAGAPTTAAPAAGGGGSNSISLNVPGSGSGVAWKSDFSETQWGSVKDAASEVYLQLRFCTANPKNKINKSRDDEDCSENVMLLGEIKDVVLPETVHVETIVEARRDSEEKKEIEQHLVFKGGSGGGVVSSGAVLLNNTFSTNTSNTTTNSNKNIVFEVTLTAQGGVALYVFLETSLPGIFSDNLFMVAPFEPQKILFYLDRSEEVDTDEIDIITEKEFEASLRVIWLQKALSHFPGVLEEERRSIVAVTMRSIFSTAFLFSLFVVVVWGSTCIYRLYM
ncbi:hypothetical protein Ndes2437B_g07964 [Nannochloris sp. 'desiccata']|nr:hypothetical protein KSW81_005836 [Chlorella desiccata (nom. nud.)]